jgi:hypothetical protein
MSFFFCLLPYFGAHKAWYLRVPNEEDGARSQAPFPSSILIWTTNFNEIWYEQRHHEPPDVRRTTVCVLTKLWDGLSIVSRLPVTVRSFYLLQNIRIDSEASLAIWSLDKSALSSRLNRRDSLPYSIKVKNEKSFTSNFPSSFMEWIRTNFYSPNLAS